MSRYRVVEVKKRNGDIYYRLQHHTADRDGEGYWDDEGPGSWFATEQQARTEIARREGNEIISERILG